MSTLLRNLLHFTRLLGDLGLDVRAGRTIDVVDAIAYVGVERRRDFYHALRCLLVHRSQDLPLFDEAFRVFWRQPPGDRTTADLRALGEKRKTGQPTVESPTSERESDGSSEHTPPTVEIEEESNINPTRIASVPIVPVSTYSHTAVPPVAFSPSTILAIDAAALFSISMRPTISAPAV